MELAPWPLLVIGCCLALAGCGSEPKTVDAQNVSVCVASSASQPPGTQVDYDFRLDGESVAQAGAQVDGAVSAEVPLGQIDVYVDGKPLGSLTTTSPSAADEDGHPLGETYLRSSPSDSCPEQGPHGRDDLSVDEN